MFVSELLADRVLQKRLRILLHGLDPLHAEYIYDLESHKDGQASTLYWHGDRAAGSWYTRGVCQTLLLLQQSDFQEHLQLQPPPLRAEDAVDLEDGRVKSDKVLLDQLYAFIVELASNRSWSQSFWSTTLPYAFAGFFATSHEARQITQRKLRRMTQAVLRLEDLCSSGPAGQKKQLGNIIDIDLFTKNLLQIK